MEMEIVNAFQFQKGLTVFTGRLVGVGRLRLPCEADLLVAGQLVGSLSVLSQRMPGPALPDDQIVVEARASFPVSAELIRSGPARLDFLEVL